MKRVLFIMSSIIVKGIIAVFASFFIIWLAVFIIQPNNILDFNLANISDNEEVVVEINPFEWEIILTHTQKLKSNLSWSPNKKSLAYFERVMEPSNNLFDREWALKIINPRTLQIKTILIGAGNTSTYEWIDKETIRIYINAGTGVRAYHDLTINQKEPWIMVEHMSADYWTPMVSK